MKRRLIMIILIGIFLLIGLEVGSQKEVPTEAEVSEVELASIYSEAPQLAERVAAGELPPVEERLPKNPVLIQPVERVGMYGGTWRMPIKNERDWVILRRTIYYEGLLRWDPQWTRPIPNIAQSFEVNEDATEYIFHLREGMRWSDGKLFTADDIMFYYEDVYLNDELDSRDFSLKTSMQIEELDDYTISIRLQEPNGLVPHQLSFPSGIWLTSYPRHYLEQFHIDYNPENIEALVEEAGVDNWVDLFNRQSAWQTNTALPSLQAWVLISGFHPGVEQVIAERNPYYWKIDTDFNQLPYIDQVKFTVFEDADEIRLAAIAGDINMDCIRVNVASHYEEYRANMDQGDYALIPTPNVRSNTVSIKLNQTHVDPTLRDIFQNKDFRIGLSYAIDRQAIIDQVFGGVGEPYQIAPRPTSPFYNERLAIQYTEYDVSLANEYLNQAGYDETDAEGYRLGPDGQRISFTLIGHGAFGPGVPNTLALVGQYWQAIGIEVTVEIMSKTEVLKMTEANEHDATSSLGGGGLDVIGQANVFLPSTADTCSFGTLWGRWYVDNSTGETPPAAPREQMDLYDQLKATGDIDKQTSLMNQILEIATDQFYSIGISTPGDVYALVGNNFHNVPQNMPRSWNYPTPAPTNPCQYFIDPQE